MYFGLLTIPAGKLFQVTSGLITLLAAGMAAQAVIFLQNGGWLEYFTGTVWDTSWLLKEDSIAGRLLHTLVGYSEAPNGAQLIAYRATIVMIVVLMRLVNKATSRPAKTRLNLFASNCAVVRNRSGKAACQYRVRAQWDAHGAGRGQGCGC